MERNIILGNILELLNSFQSLRLSSDLKVIHAKETQTLKTRLKTLESLKCDLEIKLATVTSERDHLLGYTSAMKTETRLEIFFSVFGWTTRFKKNNSIRFNFPSYFSDKLM